MKWLLTLGSVMMLGSSLLLADDKTATTGPTTTTAPATAKADADAKPANQLVVWNGEDKSEGWAWHHNACDFQPTNEDAHSGKTSLHFTGHDGPWLLVGRNFSPSRVGYDVSSKKFFSFWIKCKGGNAGSLQIHIRGKQHTETGGQSNPVQIAKYSKNFTDGEWHEIRIPLKDLNTNGVDLTSCQEFDIETPGVPSINVFIDDLSFDDGKPGETAGE